MDAVVPLSNTPPKRAWYLSTNKSHEGVLCGSRGPTKEGCLLARGIYVDITAKSNKSILLKAVMVVLRHTKYAAHSPVHVTIFRCYNTYSGKEHDEAAWIEAGHIKVKASHATSCRIELEPPIYVPGRGSVALYLHAKSERSRLYCTSSTSAASEYITMHSGCTTSASKPFMIADQPLEDGRLFTGRIEYTLAWEFDRVLWIGLRDGSSPLSRLSAPILAGILNLMRNLHLFDLPEPIDGKLPARQECDNSQQGKVGVSQTSARLNSTSRESNDATLIKRPETPRFEEAPTVLEDQVAQCATSVKMDHNKAQFEAETHGEQVLVEELLGAEHEESAALVLQRWWHRVKSFPMRHRNDWQWQKRQFAEEFKSRWISALRWTKGSQQTSRRHTPVRPSTDFIPSDTAPAAELEISTLHGSLKSLKSDGLQPTTSDFQTGTSTAAIMDSDSRQPFDASRGNSDGMCASPCSRLKSVFRERAQKRLIAKETSLGLACRQK